MGPADIRWADVIFVIERKHLNRLQAEYARLLEHKQIHSLDTPDHFRYMDPELVDMFEDAVNPSLTT
ncbi:cellular communication/signal transduction [Pseudomonas sp. AL03]|nr:cellular communication/signal transduction [Pseudomonas sp. AL03]MDI3275531.1 cellular communication/signal transduction [Pseudomonas sp. AL03]